MLNESYNICILSTLLLLSCDDGKDSSGKKLSTPTSGEATIAVDESLQPVLDATVDSFHDNYPKAKVTPLYLAEGDVLRLFMDDSVQVAVIGRDLTQAEKDYFKNIKRPV